MNGQKFQLFLKEKNVDDQTINLFLSKLKNYSKYLENNDKTLETVDPKNLVDYTEYLLTINKDSVLDFLRAILNYADYTKRYDFITNAIDIFESYNAMDNLYTRIAELCDENIRDEVFQGLTIPPLGLHPEKKPEFTKQILERMLKIIGEKKTLQLLSPCLHGRPPDDIEGDKKLLAELGIDKFLLKKHQDLIIRLEKHKEEGTLEFAQKVDQDVIEFIKNNQMFGSGNRKEELLYISKIPYQTKKYLTSNDIKLKKFYLCYCPWVRGAIKDGLGKEFSPNFCYCSGGFFKQYWDEIFELPVKIEPLEAALWGNLDCKFAIEIPEEIMKKYVHK